MTGLRPAYRAGRSGWSAPASRWPWCWSAWLLGGALGVGTVLYALAIGPLAQLFLPWCTVDVSAPRGDQG